METKSDSTAPTRMNSVFTRYLYIKNDVVWSLIQSILLSHREQSLFWGYELWVSGFRKETIDLLEYIYIEMYKPVMSKKRQTFIENSIQNAKLRTTVDYTIATIITTLAYTHKNCIRSFWDKYGDNHPIPPMWGDWLDDRIRLENASSTRMLVTYTRDDQIVKYTTLMNNVTRARLILQAGCKYYSYKNWTHDFENLNCPFLEKYTKFPFQNPIQTISDIWNHHSWEYYAARTPIWGERISAYKGVLDHDTQTVIFPNNTEELFYTKYGYEPDEQPMHIFENCIGSSD